MSTYLLPGFVGTAALVGSSKLFLQYMTSESEDPFSHETPSAKRHQVKQQFQELTGKIKLKKNTSHLYRPRSTEDRNLNLNFFNQVININPEENWVHVEGLMTYRELVKETLKHNKIPLVVPEFSSITVGGAISGVGIESSSFKHGLTYDVATEYTVLNGDGQIRTASKDENKDLFDAIPNSYGSFGYILSAKLRLKDAAPYVKVVNYKATSVEEYLGLIQKYRRGGTDFMDGMILSKNEMYLMVGYLADENEIPIGIRTSSYRQNIYYKSISRYGIDWMTIEDYFWRYDYNSFYLGDLFENRAVRMAFGGLLRSDKIKKISELSLFKSIFGGSNESIVNDLGLTVDNFSEFLEWYDQEVGVYPVWVCPYQTTKDATFFEKKGTFGIDFGIGFGVRKNHQEKESEDDPDHYKKMIDQKMFELKGRKGLYSSTFLTPEQFWSLYGSEDAFLELKQKYDPDERFYDIFEKAVQGL